MLFERNIPTIDFLGTKIPQPHFLMDFLGFEKHIVQIRSKRGASIWPGWYDHAAYYAVDLPPDAIISDIRMPGMDGVALTVKIREVQPDTPVILITGHGENGLRGQASAAGAFAFLNKPIDPIFIVALLQQALHERRSQQTRSCAV